MSKQPVKTYPTLGCCGLDCGLCPRYYTVGTSKCPGCCGPDFFNKHPSCSFITCCVNKKNLEVCAECEEFPCSKFKGFNVYDSFITYKKAVFNLNIIKEHGAKEFITQQKKRIELLEIMLKQYDEGRSKSFYCIAATLLSIADLEESLKRSRQKTNETGPDNLKIKAKILREFLNDYAAKERIELKLRKKAESNGRK